MIIKDKEAKVIIEEMQIMKFWRKYFKELRVLEGKLNQDDNKEMTQRKLQLKTKK